MGQCQSNATTHQFKPMIEDIPGTKQPGFSAIYRKVGVTELDFVPAPGINTILDAFRNSVKNYPNRNAVGYVEVKKVIDKDGKEQEKREVKNITYQELSDMAYNLGKSITFRKLAYPEPIHGMQFIGIYSKNRYQWLVVDWACVFFGITSVPLYDTLGVKNLSYCLKQTEMTTLFMSGDHVKTLLNLEQIGNIRTVILFDPIDEQAQKGLKERKIDFFYFENLLKQGHSIVNINNEHVKTIPEDCYTFSYTSGTTGPPKGAMLSHKNMLAFVRSLDKHSGFNVTEQDIYPSYLPLPHLMERGLAVVLFYYGASIVCCCGDVQKLKDDCQVIKPTFMLSVPRLYNKIVDTVRHKFAAETGIKKMLIDSAVHSKMNNLEQNGNYQSSIYDNLVFSKVREGFGGKLRLMGSGSAPLKPETHSFMMAIMCCPLLQGYGQTESSAGILYSNVHDTVKGRFAQIAQTVQMKTCDIPEMRYTANDKDQEGHQSPRGQLWIRGPHVFLGYYKQPDLTEEAITSDGWLKTGDVVQVTPYVNAFKIIDRKKNIFKLQQGQYIAPEKVENIYSKHERQLLNPSEIFLHGESDKNYTVLIAVPLKENIFAYAQEKGFKTEDYESLLKEKDFRATLLKDLNQHAKKSGLYGFQTARNIYLQPVGFMGKGILTSTMKLMRFDAKMFYKEQIKAMYQEGQLSAPKQ